jgi:DNA-binding XRE family transcriptional regulator
MTYTHKELAAKGLAPEVIKMRQWRRERRLTQAEFAQLLGVSRPYVEQIEIGRLPMPPRWPALCEHLRASWHESMRPPRGADPRGRYVRVKKAKKPAAVRGVCRQCGCTDNRACQGGCGWANDAHTLCTACTLDALGEP